MHSICQYPVAVAADDAGVLALRAGLLEMQPAQHTALRARVVVLHEGQGDARLAVAIDLEGLEEEAAMVAEYLRLDDQHPGQGRLDDLHFTASCVTRRCRYCP